VAGGESATLWIQYRATTPWLDPETKKPASSEEEEAWLRERAERNARSVFGLKDFKRDSAGATLRLVGGHKAVGWSGSFTKNEAPWTHIVLLIYSEKSFGYILLQTPSASLDGVRPDYESFVESFRLP